MKYNIAIKEKTAAWTIVAISLVYGIYGFLTFWGLMP
jgi:hypothetical protein